MSQASITVAYGDGIGPEIMEATLSVLRAASAPLSYHPIEVGEQAYLRGESTGIPDEAWETIRSTQAILKAPITTPQGGGYKSLNVTIRKTLGLYANVRPCVSYAPFVRTKHPVMDLVIVRENEEDLYGGIEHQQTDEVVQCLKLITRPGTERICRYAFEFARREGRKKVTCLTKDNIMKLTDGLFHRVFNEVGEEYPDIQKEHLIIDIGTARIADTPERFDVVVTGNLYGDIISDVAAQIAGSVGLAPSSNIGDRFAMFEAIHGSAPDIAGKGIANPSGLLLASVMMLNHLGLPRHASQIQNAWLRTIEDGIHTIEIFQEGLSSKRVGTTEFANEVIARLGQAPDRLTAVRFTDEVPETAIGAACQVQMHRKHVKKMVGIDIFVHDMNKLPSLVGEKISQIQTESLKLSGISNRGLRVWPEGGNDTYCTDQWVCRYEPNPGETIDHSHLTELLDLMTEAGIDWIKTETLFTFDGKKGFTLGQGE